MQPNKKSEKMESALESMFGVDRRKVIRANKCALCHKNANFFKDTISQAEYRISGMCQECQDGVFR